jgi:hypothetical protein
MKTSKVKFVMPKGEREVNGRQFNQYYVGMENEDKKYFLAVGEFKKKVGDVIHYKLEGDFRASLQLPPKEDNAQIHIIRQSMLKAAVDYHSKNLGNEIDEVDVVDTAKFFVNYVIHG